MAREPVRLGVVGNGWRAQFYLRLAAALPEQLSLVGVVTRRSEPGDELEARWGVPSYRSVGALVHARRPELVVSSVPWDANPEIVTALVAEGVAVVSETPPAPDREALRALWATVGGAGLVQVAEQYLLLPGHAARREVVRRGTIGTPTSVQVSSTHGYHAVALMRGLLGAGFGPTTVSARSFTAPLVDPMVRDGWTDDLEPRAAATVLATVDFGTTSGLYDFTDNQWHNQLRARRIVVRGSRGEIVDDDVISLVDARTILRRPITRWRSGYDLNLDGYDTEHLSLDGSVLWRNPFGGSRLSDEEIAISTLLVQAAAWVHGEGAGPYPLAEACQDHLVSLAIDEAVRTGETVVTSSEAWGR